MKKTITKTDGTIIVYEGTPEEIRALEHGEPVSIPAIPGIPVPNLQPVLPYTLPYTPQAPHRTIPSGNRNDDYKFPIVWC